MFFLFTIFRDPRKLGEKALFKTALTDKAKCPSEASKAAGLGNHQLQPHSPTTPPNTTITAAARGSVLRSSAAFQQPKRVSPPSLHLLSAPGQQRNTGRAKLQKHMQKSITKIFTPCITAVVRVEGHSSSLRRNTWVGQRTIEIQRPLMTNID